MSITIVVGIDTDQDRTDAIALGVTLARALDGSLLLTDVYSTVMGPNSAPRELAERHEVEGRLAHAAALIPTDVRFETRAVPSTSTVRGLHELAERVQADMIVVGATHHGRPARALAGDVTLRLLEAAPCAVAIAPARPHDPAADRAPVGVAYVPTPEGREALTTGIELAEALGTGLQILYAGPATEASEQLLADVRAEAPAGVAVETVLLDGVEPDALLRTASEGLALLVMGSRGYGPARRVLLGSVSAGVVHAAACPVIVVPRGAHIPAGHGTPA